MKAVPADLAERLHANADAFLELGDDARLDDLAERIGVARATLYYYFSGRDDITSFFMREKLGRIGRTIRSTNVGSDALDRFAAAVSGVTHELCAEPAMCLHLTAAQARPAALHDVVQTMQLEVVAPLRELLIEARAEGAEVGDLDVTISAVLGALNRVVLHQHAAGGAVAPDRVREAVLGLVLDGLRPRIA